MNQNLKTTSKLLDDFANFIENRSNLLVVGLKEVFPKILEWHFRIWQNERTFLGKEEKLDEWTSYFATKNILDSIIRRIEDRALKIRECFAFFPHLKVHLDRHKEDYVEVNHGRWYYAEDLLQTFYPSFFENIAEAPLQLDIWKHYFPKEWKVTKTNLKTNMLSGASLKQFYRWAQERINEPEEQYDKKLNNVSENLFPEVEPTVWAQILIFVFSRYGESKVRSVIERPWNFGSERIRTYSGYSEFPGKMIEIMRSETEKEKRNTFELAFMLFKDQFSKDNLQKYLEELGKLKYQEDSEEEHKRLSLLNIFSEMLKFLNQQECVVK
jgi:hypothetical protein